MNDLKLYKDILLDLFNLSPVDIQDIHFENINDDSFLFIMLHPHHESCPCCGNHHIKVKGYVDKKINHAVLTDRRLTILYKARRYACPICRTTYYEKNPFVFKKMKISILTVQKILTDLKDFNETFTSVARRYNVSPTSVASIFDAHVSIPRKKLSRFINFDEVYAFKSEYSKYVCVLLDYETKTPIDILPSRRLDFLRSYFNNIPIEERKAVEMCCADMYDGYRTICKEFFPNAKLSVDHFHIMQELHRRLTKVRIQVMNRIQKKKDIAYKERKDDPEAGKEYQILSKQYYLLKKFNWMFFKHPNDDMFDPEAKKIFNIRLQKNLNFKDILDELISIDPILENSFKIKNDVVDFYRNNNYEQAKEEINHLIQTVYSAKSDKISSFGKTLKEWKKEIINSFLIVKTDYEVTPGTGLVEVHEYKMNNAIIENRNSIIKCIKKNSNGYTNWERFRNRIMYVLDSKSTYSLEPKDNNVKKKKKK